MCCLSLNAFIDFFSLKKNKSRIDSFNFLFEDQKQEHPLSVRKRRSLVLADCTFLCIMKSLLLVSRERGFNESQKYIIYCRMYSTHISEQIPWKMYVSRISMNQPLRIFP